MAQISSAQNQRNQQDGFYSRRAAHMKRQRPEGHYSDCQEEKLINYKLFHTTYISRIIVKLSHTRKLHPRLHLSAGGRFC